MLCIQVSRPDDGDDLDQGIATTPKCTIEEAAEYNYQPHIKDAADFPSLAGKFDRCLKTVAALAVEAFSCDQRLWLAKLMHDYTHYSSIALCIADGLICSRSVLLQELEREMRIELEDARPRAPKRKRKGRKSNCYCFGHHCGKDACNSVARIPHQHVILE